MARFWTSSWLNGVSPAAMCPLLFKHNKRKNRSVKEALRNNNWILDILHDLTAQLVAEYTALLVAIQGINFDPTNEEQDEITWTLTASGEYTANSAYRMQFEGGLGSWFPKKVWSM